MHTHSLTLTEQQLQELHVTLVERIVHLEDDTQHSNATIAEISQRQLDRVRPLLALVEQKIFNIAAR